MSEEEPQGPWSELPRERRPPAELEPRVVRRLEERALLRPRRSAAAGRWLPIAAAIAGLAAGWRLRGASPPRPPAPPGAGLYLMLVSADPEGPPESAERVELYRRWARDLAAAGRLESARKLARAGARLDGAAAPARPIAFDDETPTGYFLLRAESLEAAIELARGSPHARLGGRVTVRPIDPV
jgi:hypothetical protein